MKSIIVRGSVVAAVATVLSLGLGASSQVSAQQATAAKAAAADVTPKGAWDEDTTYAVNDLVTARGSSWRAKKASTGRVPGATSPNNAQYWELFARGFNPLGAYSSAAQYQADDLVTYQGSTWRAKRTITNKTPVAGANWEQMAAVGATGATGATGPTGPAGPNTGIGDGTQNAPSISFSSDPDTGIFHPSAGNMALVQNGAIMLHTFGANNAGFGAAALQSNSSGTNNTAVGYAAMYPNSSGSNNAAFGSLALGANVSGANNTAVGSNALANSLTADNTAIGYQALKAQTSGHSNTALGAEALAANTSGVQNVAVGRLALASNNTGNNNVALGPTALQNATSTNNTAIGIAAMINLSTGGSNIAIGNGSGSGMDPAGNNNIVIGNDGSSVSSDTIWIGQTQNKAFIAGIWQRTTGQNDAVPVMVDSIGQLGVSSSSRRYKYDIETMADVSAMLAKLRPVTFRYEQAQNGDAHPLQYGLIAEEVADVFPDLAVFNKDGSAETVKYHLLPSFLLAGYQAQQQTIDKQAEKIEAQSGEIAALKERVAATDALEARLRRLEALLPQSAAALQ